MRKIEKIIGLASIFALATVTNIFAETGAKSAPSVSWTEIVIGIGVGIFVGSVIKAIRRGRKSKANSMYDGKGAKVPPMQSKKKKKKKK